MNEIVLEQKKDKKYSLLSYQIEFSTKTFEHIVITFDVHLLATIVSYTFSQKFTIQTKALHGVGMSLYLYRRTDVHVEFYQMSQMY